MSDTTDQEVKLKAAIDAAKISLSKTFGDAGADKYESLTYFQEDGLAEAYQKEEVFTNMAKQFSSLGKEVRSMRSSFLPVELFKEDGALSPELSDGLGKLESHENAFMRMLGMPQSDELGLASGGASDDDSAQTGSITYVTKSGEHKPGASFADVEREVLDQRAKRKADRKVKVNNYIFDLDKKTADEVKKKDANSLSLNDEVLDEVDYPKLDEFEQNPYAFSYLLFPPIQDSRFSKCINEPGKIVAPLFGNQRARQINSTKIKPTLLESIIRIRIDRLSGQDSQKSLKIAADNMVEDEAAVSIDISVGSGEEEDTVVPYSESYGILEALFIIRLRSAILGLSRKFAKDREEIVASMEKIGMKVTEPGPEPDPDGLGSTSNGEASTTTEWDEMMPLVADFLAKSRLEEQLLIEDSMMALFGNSSGAIDLQKNTQRNSSVHDAHLMSGLIGVVDVPRGRIRERLAEIQSRRANNVISQIDPIREGINAILGTDIGIGNLDMLVFSLALFSISEVHLLNLLSDSAYDRLKEATLGDALDNIADRSLGREGRIAAVNEVSDFAYAGYQVFVKGIAG